NRRIAAEKYAEYSTALAPVLELEARLIRNLREDDDEDEATRLGDGSAPGWSVPRGEYAVRTTSNWKRALTLGRSRSKRKSASVSVPWWEDPSDPVHTLESCRNSMNRLWKDEWVRRRLVEKRVRLQESSGFYLDEIERITAKMYAPTDEDVLKARLKTVGVVEHSFTINMGSIRGNSNWVIYDVGGSRSQRHAWAPFSKTPHLIVNAIIFLAPISAFDQVLTEVILSATALIPIVWCHRTHVLIAWRIRFLLWRAVVSNKLLESSDLRLLREKIEAGVQLKNHLLTYGDRPNEYEPVSKCAFCSFIWVVAQSNSSNRDRELFKPEDGADGDYRNYMQFTSRR
ncbi:guanine nucleotide binding protein, alpha subunit, partial [Multifurca ochricompacta]